jgi:hypothetical protein
MLLLRSQAYTLYESGTLPAPLTATLPECNKQADLLDKFYATTNAALVCANINGAYTLYLDGKPLLRGSSMIEQQAALTRLTPGLHTLLLKVSWTHPDNWINVHLRTHTTNLWSDLSWECAQQPDTTDWQPCVYRGVLPKMSWVRFAPNAMVYTQHHPLTGPQPGWDAPGKTCYFRKTFGIPESE